MVEGFKETEVGLLPSDWVCERLPDVVDYIHGKAHEQFVNENGEFVIVNSKFISSEGEVRKYSNKNFQPGRIGDILTVLSDLPNGKALAKCFFVDRNDYYAVNQRVCIWRSKGTDSSFLFHVLNRNKYFLNLNDGVSQTHILNKHIEECPIQVPPTKAEQTAIATALNDADALITALEKLIAKKKAIKQGAMQELLKPKGGWKPTTVAKLGSPFGGLSGKSKADFKNGNSPYIPFMNVMSNPIIDTTYFDFVKIGASESQNRALKGDLFFNGSSETPEELGMCSVLLEDIQNLYLNSFCFGFRLFHPEKTNGLYLAYFFRSSYGRQIFQILSQGATRHNLSKSNFLKTEILIPEPPEQKEIAEIIYDMDNEIHELEQKLEKQKQIKQGMMQVLLTGKIRLM